MTGFAVSLAKKGAGLFCARYPSGRSGKRLLIPFLPMVLVVMIIGCGPTGPTPIPVHGKITFDGRPCPAAGTITFSPVETPEGVPRRPGSGEFNEDGQYQIRSYAPGDGLLPGRYRVNIECVSGLPPQRPGGFEEVSYIAPNYEPEELAVSVDSSKIEANYDVPLKK